MNFLSSIWYLRKNVTHAGASANSKLDFAPKVIVKFKELILLKPIAPVINWNSVMIMIILSTILGLLTKQINYTADLIRVPIYCNLEWDYLSEEEQ